MKYLTLILLISLTGVSLLSQSNKSVYQDEFQLKNGLKFTGRVIDFNNERILIEREDSTLIHIKHDEFLYIRQNDPVLQFKNVDLNLNSDRRLFGNILLGFGFGGGNENFLSAISFQTGLLYKLSEKSNKHFFRMNTGVDSYTGLYEAALLPLTAGYEVAIDRGRLSPYFSIDGGYSLPLSGIGKDENPFGTQNHQGGVKWEAGMGIKFRGSNNTAFLLQGTYAHQQAGHEFNGGWGGTSSLKYVFRRVFIKFGFLF